MPPGIIPLRRGCRGMSGHLHILIDLNVSKNGRPFFVKTWTASEPRRLL